MSNEIILPEDIPTSLMEEEVSEVTAVIEAAPTLSTDANTRRDGRALQIKNAYFDTVRDELGRSGYDIGELVSYLTSFEGKDSLQQVLDHRHRRQRLQRFEDGKKKANESRASRQQAKGK